MCVASRKSTKKNEIGANETLKDVWSLAQWPKKNSALFVCNQSVASRIDYTRKRKRRRVVCFLIVEDERRKIQRRIV